MNTLSMHNQRPAATDSKPWYKQFWPWFLIAIPLSSVIMGIVMINLALRSEHSLVRDDWYKDGMAINERLDSQHLARELGIKAWLSVNRDGGQLLLRTEQIPAEHAQALELQLIHPTLAQQDKTVVFYPAPDGQYFGQVNPLPKGMYYLKLSAPGAPWVISGQVNFANDLQQEALHTPE